jgi:hypothetical protein
LRSAAGQIAKPIAALRRDTAAESLLVRVD